MMIGSRISERLDDLGLSQAELARRVGISQPAINGLIRGASRSSTHLHVIARELQTTPAFLTGEIDDPAQGAAPPPTPTTIADHFDLVAIQEIDLAYGLGGTFTDDAIDVQTHHFPRAWVEAITLTPPEMLTFARGRGDSMVPTMMDGDMVLIDRSQKTVREQDALWALTLGEIAMIKRLRVRGERVSILSDNERVPTDEAHHEEVNVVGRVIFIGRRT